MNMGMFGKRLYGQISKRNQFQSNIFFKRLKLYFFYPNMPIFMTDQNDTYLSHYSNATHHTTSDTNMSFIEINTKKHGRWRSETAKDGYVKDSLPDRLSVSKKIGL
jgi:hypothetical protein